MGLKRKGNGRSMDCKEAEEHYVPYLLGALESSEMELMERHVEGCASCSRSLLADSDIVVDLAYAVPQQNAPLQVKSQLMARIDADAPVNRPVTGKPGWPSLLLDFGQALLARPSAVATSLLLVVVVWGGIWFNQRLDQVAEERDELADRVETMALGEAEMTEKVRNLVDLSYVAAAPDTAVSPLTPTDKASTGRGMILVPKWGQWALLAAYNMPSLPPSKVYQVWLVKDNEKFSAGRFTVDPSGYGGTRLNLLAPFSEIEAIVITVEGTGSSVGPTGESVLWGDF